MHVTSATPLTAPIDGAAPAMEMPAVDAMPENGEDGIEMDYDDSLTDLEKFESFITSGIPLQRLVYVKRLAESAKDAGFESTLERICPMIPHIAEDNEMVIRQALAWQLSGLVTFLISKEHEGRAGYEAITNIILPALNRLVHDENLEVRQETIDALAEVAQTLPEKEADDHLIDIITKLCASESDDLRSSGIVLLNKCAPSLGASVCRTLCLDQLVALSKDTSFRVRKTVAHNLDNVPKVTGTAFTIEHLIPIFECLSKDAIWSVRKGCVESLVPMSECVTRTEHVAIIVPMFRRFIKDVSRWVRNESYEVLGKFLHSLDDDLITPDILRFYTEIPSLSNSVVDSDVSYFCAFSFPAVVTRLGRNRWSELSQVYSALCKDSKFKVRRTLSHSLHLVAKTLGTELTDTQLLPTFEMFLKDLDEVRVGIFKNLADMLSMMSSKTRCKYLETLWDIQREADHNWRFRLLLAQQLPRFSRLFPVDILSTSIVPLAMTLSRDRISDVRQAASLSLAHFLKELKPANEEAHEEMMNEVLMFSESNSYQERQLFIRMAGAMVDLGLDDDFTNRIVDRFECLANDCVVNVRISLARFLRDRLLRHGKLKHNVKVQSALLKLRSDECHDVSDFFSICSGELDQLLRDHAPEEVPDEGMDNSRLDQGADKAAAPALASPTQEDPRTVQADKGSHESPVQQVQEVVRELKPVDAGKDEEEPSDVGAGDAEESIVNGCTDAETDPQKHQQSVQKQEEHPATQQPSLNEDEIVIEVPIQDTTAEPQPSQAVEQEQNAVATITEPPQEQEQADGQKPDDEKLE